MGLRSWIIETKDATEFKNVSKLIIEDMKRPDGGVWYPEFGFIYWRYSYWILTSSDGSIDFSQWKVQIFLLEEVPHEPNGFIKEARYLEKEECERIFGTKELEWLSNQMIKYYNAITVNSEENDGGIKEEEEEEEDKDETEQNRPGKSESSSGVTTASSSLYNTIIPSKKSIFSWMGHQYYLHPYICRTVLVLTAVGVIIRLGVHRFNNP